MLGLMAVALLPVAAAVSAEPAIKAPVAIAQPLGFLGVASVPLVGQMLAECGLLMMIGTGLMALAAIVRRTTKQR